MAAEQCRQRQRRQHALGVAQPEAALLQLWAGSREAAAGNGGGGDSDLCPAAELLLGVDNGSTPSFALRLTEAPCGNGLPFVCAGTPGNDSSTGTPSRDADAPGPPTMPPSLEGARQVAGELPAPLPLLLALAQQQESNTNGRPPPCPLELALAGNCAFRLGEPFEGYGLGAELLAAEAAGAAGHPGGSGGGPPTRGTVRAGDFGMWVGLAGGSLLLAVLLVVGLVAWHLIESRGQSACASGEHAQAAPGPATRGPGTDNTGQVHVCPSWPVVVASGGPGAEANPHQCMCVCGAGL